MTDFDRLQRYNRKVNDQVQALKRALGKQEVASIKLVEAAARLVSATRLCRRLRRSLKWHRQARKALLIQQGPESTSAG